MTTEMAFGLLGPMSVSRLGRAINITAGRQRAVLAALLFSPTRSGQIGDLDQQARADEGLGNAFRALGEPDRARFHWQQALTRYAELGVPEATRLRTALTGPALPAVRQAGGTEPTRISLVLAVKTGHYPERSPRAA